MKYLFLIIGIAIGTVLFSQSKYVYADIPDSLKKNADYVVWEEELDFEIKNHEKANIKIRKAICILDQHSKNYNDVYIPYNKENTISSFSAEIYDKYGKLVKRLKKSDIKDVSAVSGHSLYEDDRYMVAEFTHNQYPYTLVYELKQKLLGLLNYPSWSFQGRAGTGVISSKVIVTASENFDFKYREYNLKNKVEVNIIDGKKKSIWTETCLKPIEISSKMPPAIYYQPKLLLAPTTFKAGGIESKMNTWEELGAWEWELNKGRDILPEITKQKIKKLVNGVKSERDKIRILYEYMQNKTRYVSVQLGIGGQQTYPADYVDEKGYGDCKALSNYMYSMLKEVGIKSHYTTIYAGSGEEDIISDFPSNQFNHVILCVPQEKDTVWLECTNQKKPFNFLGTHSDDRHALLITEEGGKLVKTPKYGKDVNTQYRNVNLKLDANGNAKAKVYTKFNGLKYENREGWSSQSVKEQKDALKGTYGISGMEINNFKFTELKDEIPSIHEDLDLTIMRFASTSSKRMFIK